MKIKDEVIAFECLRLLHNGIGNGSAICGQDQIDPEVADKISMVRGDWDSAMTETHSLDEISDRFLKPLMTGLASQMESLVGKGRRLLFVRPWPPEIEDGVKSLVCSDDGIRMSLTVKLWSDAIEVSVRYGVIG